MRSDAPAACSAPGQKGHPHIAASAVSQPGSAVVVSMPWGTLLQAQLLPTVLFHSLHSEHIILGHAAQLHQDVKPQ